MLCYDLIMSHYCCDVVPSYVILMVYYVLLCKTASGRRETNRQGRTKDPSPRFFFEPRKLASKSAFEAHHASILFANGGLRPPQPPRCFKPCGAAHPPPPPPKPPNALNFKPCKLASKYISVLFRTLSCGHCVWDVL